MHFSTPSRCLLSCLLFGATTLASRNNDTVSTCEALSSILPTEIFYPDTDTYNASISSYPFIQLRLHPTCIVRPKTAQDVSAAVNLLRDTGCTKFAVKGGGHNANVGFNNIEDGVTIDMQSMNEVEVVEATEVARVGAGALWQNVYDAVEPHNLTVLGGRIGVVGVAGFTTGGGVSFFSPSRGWACDAVVNFELVLADGTIANANATSNADLYAALKGGQNNFGIITRFDLQAFPLEGPIWGGRIAFNSSAEADLVSAFTEFKSSAYDPHAAGWVTWRYNVTTNQTTPTSILWYTKPEQKPGALKPIVETKPQLMNGMTTGTPREFAKNASMVVKTSNLNTIWATTTFKISPRICHRIHLAWKTAIPSLLSAHASSNPASELTFQSIPPPPRNDSSPNSLGFSATDTPEKDLVFLQIVFYYNTDASASKAFNAGLKDFIKMFDDIAEDEGVSSGWVYLNFAARFQDPLGSYGREQLGKLKRVARKYDPRGLFQKQLVGGFKVSAAEAL